MKNKKTVQLTISVVFIIIVGFIDRFSGEELSLSIFYLMPISFCAWFISGPWAVAVAAASEIVEFFVNISFDRSYSHYAVPLWNAVMRLIVYLSLVFFITAFKRELRKQKDLARTDSLTGLANSRYFSEAAEAERNKSARFNRPLSIAYIDIDNFKQVNDEFGHDAGDELLSSIGKAIKECVRGYDITARVGGDEFVILLPETDRRQAEGAVQKILNRLLFVAQKYAKFVTFSVGVVTFNKSPNSVNEMIKHADQVMYKVKNKNKNNHLCIEID